MTMASMSAIAKRGGVLAGVVLLAAHAAAQFPVSGTTYTQLSPILFGNTLSNPAAASLPASPNAAYSNVSTGPGLQTSTGGASSATVVDDIRVTEPFIGQRVNAIRIACYNTQNIGMPFPQPGPVTVRAQIGFWNADAFIDPNAGLDTGLPGTPLMMGSSQAGYVTNSFTLPANSFGIITIPLGENGFTLPQGRFYILALFQAMSPSATTIGMSFGQYAGPPAVGISTNQYGYNVSAGLNIPFGFSFEPFSPFFINATGRLGGAGVELIIPAPPTAVLAMLAARFALRRRRS